MKRTHKRQKGQALVMVTVALVAMFAIMGLTVDVGWSYYLEKSAQAAADAAALAAVSSALGTSSSSYTCGGVFTCAAAPVNCPGAAGNLAQACAYAASNGFTTGGRQTVTVQASDSASSPTVTGCAPLVQHPPTAPCVDTMYWVTVRVSEEVPQLFSAVLGRTMGTVSARATAGVVRSVARGSLILLNRENDISIHTGTNLYSHGGAGVIAPGGIILASNQSDAGDITGNVDIISPFTTVRSGGGVVTTGAAASWDSAEPPTVEDDGETFYDPFENRQQLPINSSQSSVRNVPVLNGELTDAICPGGVCAPGNYYAVNAANQPTGAPITINESVTFTGSGTNFSNGDYVFFGGMTMHRGTVDFGPGRYVFAGSLSGTPVLSVDNGVTITGGNGSSADPGRAFIYTDETYGGQLATTAARISGLSSLNLGYGGVDIQAGNNSRSRVSLFGLNPANAEIQSLGLEDYPIAMWQDRLNSTVKYQSNGFLDLAACGGTINSPCAGAGTATTARMTMWAGPDATYGGVIYQPRGSTMRMQGSPGSAGALQIITGALEMGGSGALTLTSPLNPVTRLVSALVE